MTDQKSDDARGVNEPQVLDLTAEEIKPQAEAPAEMVENGKPQDEAQPETDETPGPWREEVQSEPEMAEPPPPPSPPPPPQVTQPARKRSANYLWILAALLLGLLAGGWLYRNQLANYFPTDEMAAMRVRIDTLETQAQTLGNQIAAAGQSIEGATQAAAAAAEQAKAADANVAALSAIVEATDQRIVTTEQALEQARADLGELRKSISTSGSGTGTAGGSVDNAALAALGQRIDQLEKDIVSLKSAAGGGDTASVTSALSQALSDLKAKVAAGTAYAAEYDRIARMVPAAPGLEVLGRSAQEGLPAVPGLVAELRAAIPALPQPEAPAPAGDSYWDGLLDTLSGVITIRQIGEANWPQLAEKAGAFAEAGDLGQAISTIDAGEGEKPMALTQWRDRAAARIRLEAALEQVSDAVLRQIAALGGVK